MTMATTNDSDTMDAMDIEEDCPLCCEPYNNTQYERSRVTCSAENGCGMFSVCRLCVFRLDMQLRERPFVVNDDTGDFVQLDPTVCPQCKRPGAFQEDKLPMLSEEVKRAAEEEVRTRREEAARRQSEQALRRLNEAPGAALIGDENVSFTATPHERIKIISGDRHPDKFCLNHHIIGSGLAETCSFQEENTTIGVPDLLSSSGIIYYEIFMLDIAAFFHRPKIQFGFALVDGMAVTDGPSEMCVGDNARSWGFDGLTGGKIHIDSFGDDRTRSKWGPGSMVGVAANLEKGMIAVSLNGDWQLVNGNGVKFEDESIKAGVYPCISGKQCVLECRFGPDFKHALPPSSLWDAWPKFDDDTWLGITEEARAAAMVLGYTQQSWMGSGNPIERKSWNELSKEEQAAANILGYNGHIWAQLTTLWADEDDGDSSDFSDDDMDYAPQYYFSSIHWNNLPGDARIAAETLGYTPTIWNDDDAEGPLDAMSWDELTQEQQRAAVVLGYDKESWNEDSDSDSSDSDSSDIDSSGHGALPFDHMAWHELPRDAREAAEKLGHSAETWDQNLQSSWDVKRWGELPLEQQFAAAVLGYDESKWNNAIDLAHNIASVVFLGRPNQR